MSIVDTREILEATWRRFTKTALFVDSFRGGSKTEEFTVTDNGFHFHIHSLAITKYLHFNEVRRRWTECFHAACLERFGKTFDIATADRHLLLKILRVTDRDNAIFEVCKYITKTFSLGMLSNQQLGELALIKRWPRAFELFGSFRSAEEKPILDKENLSAGRSHGNKCWYDCVIQFGFPVYSSMLENEFDRRIDWYKSKCFERSWNA